MDRDTGKEQALDVVERSPAASLLVPHGLNSRGVDGDTGKEQAPEVVETSLASSPLVRYGLDGRGVDEGAGKDRVTAVVKALPKCGIAISDRYHNLTIATFFFPFLF